MTGEIGKGQLFLEVASNLVLFYTFTGHALRALTDESAAAQLSPEQVETQLNSIWAALAPRLTRNPVVKKKLEDAYQNTQGLIRDFQKLKQDDPAFEEIKQDVIRRAAHAKEKSAALSDLVALFRSL